MHTIIASTDFSEASINAVNYAAEMALHLNANLLLVHVTELPINRSHMHKERRDHKIEAERKLDVLERKLKRKIHNKISIQTKRVNGLIENEIVKICSCKNPLAVVMATKGASLKEHFFVESITVFLSTNLEYPVIVVPPKIHFKAINKILLATDLENLYGLNIESIINIVSAFKAHIDIVHVYKNVDKFDVMTSRMNELTNYLSSLNPKFHFVYNEDVFEGLIDFAKQNNSDMILTFPKKHAFFHRSKSKQLIFNAPFTVMTIQ